MIDISRSADQSNCILYNYPRYLDEKPELEASRGIPAGYNGVFYTNSANIFFIMPVLLIYDINNREFKTCFCKRGGLAYYTSVGARTSQDMHAHLDRCSSIAFRYQSVNVRGYCHDRDLLNMPVGIFTAPIGHLPRKNRHPA